MNFYAKKSLSIFLIAISLSFCFPAYGEVYTNGPSGGYGGKSFSIWPASPHDKMKIDEIRIRAGSLIDSIQVVYKYTDTGAISVEGPFGGSGGQQYIFKLDDDEYIQSMSGYCDNLIHSIKFVTNKKESPNYGGKGGTRFFRYRPPSNMEIAGFFGRSGVYIDAIGAYYRVVDQSKKVAGFDFNEHAGLSGGDGGNRFGITPPYDMHATGEDCTISEISIWADAFVNGIQVTYRHYANNTNQILSPVLYGSMSGYKRTLLLDSNEYITAIFGKYGDVIDSIRFETTKRTSPKYGGNGGAQWYKYEAPKESRINGFLGYSGIHIDSIGVVTSSMFPSGDSNMETIIFTPSGTAIKALLMPELPQNELIERDQAIEDIIKNNGWNAHIISKSTTTYNCHGYAWHGIKQGERCNIDGAEIPKYWEDGSYIEIEEDEAAIGDIIYYCCDKMMGSTVDHSAVITNITDQGLWCISKWGDGPLVGHYSLDCEWGELDLRYYRKNR